MGRQLGAVALLLLCSFCTSETKKDDCGKTLDVRLDNVIGMSERQIRQAKMREFLWNNWHQRQCATLHLKSISKEGKETDTDYEIRPLSTTLAMVVTINRARYGYQGQVLWHQDGKYDVYWVERVTPNNPYLLHPNSKVEVIADNAALSGSEYCLRFTGWGHEVLSFF